MAALEPHPEPEGDLLCPNCDYPRRGLPEDARCPECGFAWDRDMRILFTTSKQAYMLVSIGVLGVVVPFAIVIRTGHAPWALLSWGSVILTIGLMYARRQRRVVLSHDGIKLIGIEEGPDFLNWKQVARVGWSRFRSSVCLWDASGERIASIAADYFGSTAKAARFIDTVRFYLARHQRLDDEQARSENVDC